MPDGNRVHVDNALRDQIAHQCSLIGIARRQTDNLRVRWICIEISLCFEWIVDYTQSGQFLGYLAYDCANIQFRKSPVWSQTQSTQTLHFCQLMGLPRLKGIEPIDGQTSFVRSGGPSSWIMLGLT